MKQRLDFPGKEKIETIDRLAIIERRTQLLNQRLDFPGKEKIETIDRLAIILGQKHTVEATVRFSSWKKLIKTMERLAIILS